MLADQRGRGERTPRSWAAGAFLAGDLLIQARGQALHAARVGQRAACLVGRAQLLFIAPTCYHPSEPAFFHLSGWCMVGMHLPSVFTNIEAAKTGDNCRKALWKGFS